VTLEWEADVAPLEVARMTSELRMRIEEQISGLRKVTSDIRSA